MNIGDKIREERIKKKMTQKELAISAGIAEISVRQYETGKRQPKVEQLQKIANALNVSANIFIYSKEEILKRLYHNLGEVEGRLYNLEDHELKNEDKQGGQLSYKNKIQDIENEIAAISSEISELGHIEEKEQIVSTWKLIQDMDSKRTGLIIEILRTHNYQVGKDQNNNLIITDHQGFSFNVDKDDFQEMLERSDRDIRYNIEKVLNDSKRIEEEDSNTSYLGKTEPDSIHPLK